MIVRQISLLVISCLCMTVSVAAQGRGNAGQAVPMAYELYSWRQANGGWSFRVLASPSGPNVSSDQVFDKRFLLSGVKELKRKILGLPAGSTVFWLDRIIGATQESKESEKLGYPPSEMMEDIRHYAEMRKVNVELHSGQRGQQ